MLEAEAILVCDKCSSKSKAMPYLSNENAFRSYMLSLGWTVAQGLDYCPNCSKYEVNDNSPNAATSKEGCMRPSQSDVQKARMEIEKEDQERRAVTNVSNSPDLPSEDPNHTCGMHCDGQDGTNSYCARIRRKLFGGILLSSLLSAGFCGDDGLVERAPVGYGVDNKGQATKPEGKWEVTGVEIGPSPSVKVEKKDPE